MAVAQGFPEVLIIFERAIHEATTISGVCHDFFEFREFFVANLTYGDMIFLVLANASAMSPFKIFIEVINVATVDVQHESILRLNVAFSFEAVMFETKFFEVVDDFSVIRTVFYGFAVDVELDINDFWVNFAEDGMMLFGVGFEVFDEEF